MQSISDLFFRAQKQSVDPFNHNRGTYGPSYVSKEGKCGPFYWKKGYIKAKCGPYYVQKRGSGKMWTLFIQEKVNLDLYRYN